MLVCVGVDVTGGGGVWLRIDSADSGHHLAFANMWDRRVVGTTEWSRHCVELDVPDAAARVAWGFYLHGPGQLWVTGLQLEAVTSGDAKTSGLGRDGE